MEQQSFVGLGSIARLNSILHKYSHQKVFLLHGRGSYVACGAKDILTPLFRENDNDVVEFTDFSANPKSEEAMAGLELLRQSEADIIVAVGGGSVLDTAKLIRVEYEKLSKRLSLVAIPTTAGTGAEATRFAVVYKNGFKTSIESDNMIPDVAIVDGRFLLHNPKYLAVCTGFDAFAQGVEAFWNVNATDESNQYAASYQMMQVLLNQLNDSEDGEISELVADQLARSSYEAGRAINITRTTAPHACSYTFTSKFGYPHGHAVALTFPFWAEKNILCSPDEYNGLDFDFYRTNMDLLRKNLHLDETDDISGALKKWIYSLGLKPNKPFEVGAILDNINEERFKNNPCKLTPKVKEELRTYLENLK